MTPIDIDEIAWVPGVCYTRFCRLIQHQTTRYSLLLGLSLILLSASLSPLQAADLRYVKSPEIDLNVRRGPGTEHAVLTRLPHGTPVFVQERVGLWLRITAPNRGIEGWVLQTYLNDSPPGDPEELAAFDPAEEKERFDRLTRRGILNIRPNQNRTVLHLSMNGLIWHRLTPHQQANFLQRAYRLHNISTVEMRDQQTQSVLARLIASSPDSLQFEFPN